MSNWAALFLLVVLFYEDWLVCLPSLSPALFQHLPCALPRSGKRLPWPELQGPCPCEEWGDKAMHINTCREICCVSWGGDTGMSDIQFWFPLVQGWQKTSYPAGSLQDGSKLLLCLWVWLLQISFRKWHSGFTVKSCSQEKLEVGEMDEKII
jgi:hypothetical protein